jgi:hypothetical protein
LNARLPNGTLAPVDPKLQIEDGMDPEPDLLQLLRKFRAFLAGLAVVCLGGPPVAGFVKRSRAER